MLKISIPEAVARVAKLDLSKVRSHLINRDGLSPERADNALDLYRKMLALGVAGEPAVATSLGDLAWHGHLLNSAKYRADCFAISGRMFDHDPHAAGTDEFRANWARTVALFAEHFGITLESDADALDAHDLAPAFCQIACADLKAA